MDLYRIHGDNIVECERIANIIIAETRPAKICCTLTSPSTITFILNFNYENQIYEWQLDLLPGFNKSGRHGVRI